MEIIGKGSVVQRDKSKTRARCRDWELSVWIKSKGKKKRKTKAFRGSWSSAQDALDQFVEDLRDMIIDSDMSVVSFAWYWHDMRVKSMRLSEKTLDGDQYKINVIDMHLDCSIKDVTSDMIIDVYWRLSQGETPSGRPYKPKSIEDFHKAMTSIFKLAEKKKLIQDNPMDDVRPPRVEDEHPPAIPSQNADYLIEYLDYSSPIQRTVALIAATGLRIGEACRLDWADVGSAWVTVRKSKNHSQRIVPIPEHVLERLEPCRARGLVCEGVKEASVRRWMVRHGAEFFIPGQSPHDLRHSYCTRLAEAGVHPKTMMELMGHKTIEVCMNIYTHVNNMTKIQAVILAFSRHDDVSRAGFERELSECEIKRSAA